MANADLLLHQLAFENSAQANIIFNVKTGHIITANDMACQLLGYSKEEIAKQTRETIFDTSDENYIKMMMERKAEGHSAAKLKVLKKDGKQIACDITSAVFVDEDHIEKAITTLTDLSQAIQEQKDIDTHRAEIVAENIVVALEKSDERVTENTEWIKHIAKNSYDVMWDWDILSGEVYVGDSLEDVFGYKVSNNIIQFSDLKNRFFSSNTNNIEENLMAVLASDANNWNDAYEIRKSDGSIASVISRATIIRDEQGKAIRLIGATQDISVQHELEDKLRNEVAARGKFFEAFQKNFRMIFHSSSELLYDLDLLTGQVILSDAYEKEFGYHIKNNLTTAADWFSHIHPEEKEKVMQDMQNSIASGKPSWKCSFRFIKADQTIADTAITGVMLKDFGGKAYRMMGSMQDLSNQKTLENKLEREIKLKETQIAEATVDARESERSEIGKELHDNVNQLLGVSKLYLEMSKRGGPDSEMYLDRSSEYTLSAIEAIRSLTKTLTTDVIKNLGLCEAIENIAKDTMEVNSVKISLDLKGFIEAELDNKFKLNIFRIIQEQLNNILKHAQATQVVLSLSQEENTIHLDLSDNGVGFNTTEKTSGIGMDNIKNRAATYHGTAEFISEKGQGCLLKVRFPDISPAAA